MHIIHLYMCVCIYMWGTLYIKKNLFFTNINKSKRNFVEYSTKTTRNYDRIPGILSLQNIVSIF